MYFNLKTVANLPKEKLKIPVGLKPKIPDPVPELALEPSVYQIRAPSGKMGLCSSSSPGLW
jgi:hypothetical protein